MAIGYFIRRSFGPFEKTISNLYRSIFMDIRLLAEYIAEESSSSKKVLEIGCGEGALMENLVPLFPKTEFTGIDIAPTVGRLFQAHDDNVKFIHADIENFSSQCNVKFDLILICDVLHHVPEELQRPLLKTAKSLLENDGVIIVKDWEGKGGLINSVSYFLERYITGDKVGYKSEFEWKKLLREVFGNDAIRSIKRIQPWKNNIMFVMTKSE